MNNKSTSSLFSLVLILAFLFVFASRSCRESKYPWQSFKLCINSKCTCQASEMGEALAFIKSIARRAQIIEQNLERDLAQMDKLLRKIPEDADSTKVDLRRIRRSLTLHRLFHLGEENQSEVCDLDREDALDPGSIILKIVRTHTMSHNLSHRTHSMW